VTIVHNKKHIFPKTFVEGEKKTKALKKKITVWELCEIA
jgi:hypothetical protein